MLITYVDAGGDANYAAKLYFLLMMMLVDAYVDDHNNVDKFVDYHDI